MLVNKSTAKGVIKTGKGVVGARRGYDNMDNMDKDFDFCFII